VRDQEWDSTLAKLNALDLAELVLGLLGLDAVDGEAALGVVDETEVLASLLDGDDVHEAGWVGGVGADLSVDLDQALHDDGLGLASIESILQAVTDEDDQRHAVAELVWTGGWARSVGTGQFVQEPVGWRAQALLVLLSVEQTMLACFLHLGVRRQAEDSEEASIVDGHLRIGFLCARVILTSRAGLSSSNVHASIAYSTIQLLVRMLI